MTSAAVAVNTEAPGIGQRGSGPYDWRRTRRRDRRRRRVELTPPVARYEQVARHLAARIYDGTYAAGDALPGAPSLAAALGVSQSVAQQAVELLERRGLVRRDVGRGTVVIDRRLYRVTVAGIRWAGDESAMKAAFDAASDGLAAAGRADPAVAGAGHAAAGPELEITMDVQAANPARAADAAWVVAEGACRDGWDLDGAAVHAEPAGAPDSGKP